jgi:glutamate-1-semialdehyde aminotransferase
VDAGRGDPFPHFVASAQGYEIVDTLGALSIDWVGGGGAVLLGQSTTRRGCARCSSSSRPVPRSR